MITVKFFMTEETNTGHEEIKNPHASNGTCCKIHILMNYQIHSEDIKCILEDIKLFIILQT